MWRDLRELPHPLLPSEDTARRWPSVIQEADPHKTLNILVPWSWSSQPPDPWETNVCRLSHLVHSVVLQQPKWTKTSGLQRPQVVWQITPCLSYKIYLLPPPPSSLSFSLTGLSALQLFCAFSSLRDFACVAPLLRIPCPCFYETDSFGSQLTWHSLREVFPAQQFLVSLPLQCTMYHFNLFVSFKTMIIIFMSFFCFVFACPVTASSTRLLIP